MKMSRNKVGHENSTGNHNDVACFLWSICRVRYTCGGRKGEKKKKKRICGRNFGFAKHTGKKNDLRLCRPLDVSDVQISE